MSSGSPGPRRVLITGIAGRLGRLLVRRLRRQEGLSIWGIDRRPFDDRPRDVEHLQADLRAKRVLDTIRGRAGEIHALVHLGLWHDPSKSSEERHEWNVSGTSRLLSACADAGVR